MTKSYNYGLFNSELKFSTKHLFCKLNYSPLTLAMFSISVCHCSAEDKFICVRTSVKRRNIRYRKSRLQSSFRFTHRLEKTTWRILMFQGLTKQWYFGFVSHIVIVESYCQVFPLFRSLITFSFVGLSPSGSRISFEKKKEPSRKNKTVRRETCNCTHVNESFFSQPDKWHLLIQKTEATQVPAIRF